MFPDARLNDWRPGGGEFVVFDPDEAVCAVKEAGSLTGLVGDLGLGFLNPVCGGEAPILVFVAPVAVETVVEAVVGRLAGFETAGAFFSTLFSGFFSETFLACSLLLGVVGVLGRGDFKLLVGEALGGTEVFAVDIGAGFAVLSAAGFSTAFATAGFEVPFVCAGGGAFFSSFCATGFTSSFFRCPLPRPNCLSTSIEGVSIALSGIVSSTNELRFLASNSEAIDCFLSVVSFGLSCSSILKLVLRFDKLGSPLVSLFNSKPICPLRPTVTKLVRTFDSGRGDVPLLPPSKHQPQSLEHCKIIIHSPPIELPPGERPRSGRSVVPLFSNMARRLCTPDISKVLNILTQSCCYFLGNSHTESQVRKL